MSEQLQRKIIKKRYIKMLYRRLSKVRLKVYDHEDMGIKDKHDRVVKKIMLKIKKLEGS